jgi:hypothetical protein
MWLLLLVAVLLLVPLAYAIWRSTELFATRARAGNLELVRGRLPPALFSELRDIAQRERLDGVQVRAVLEGGAPRLVVSGPVSAGTEQALRNVLGRFRLSQIRTGTLRR